MIEYQKELKNRSGYSLRFFNWIYLLNQMIVTVTEEDMREFMGCLNVDNTDREKHMQSYKNRMVESQIYRKIKNDKQMALFKEKLARLRREYDVQVNEDYFKHKSN